MEQEANLLGPSFVHSHRVEQDDSAMTSLLAFDSIVESPFENESHTATARKRTRCLPFLDRGSRSGVAACAATVTTVLLLNIVLTSIIAASVKGFVGGTGKIFEGSCSKARTYNTTVHLVINIFSTLLLSCSNYCMQCLCAPTRADVDKAHTRRKTLDIGVPSIKNLFSVDRWRGLFWVALCLSSVPLHLVYNSAVYFSISANDYVIVNVNAAFLGAMPAKHDALTTFAGDIAIESKVYNFTTISGYLRQLAHAGELQRLEPAECIEAYHLDYVSARSNVLLVTPLAYDNTSSPKIHASALDDNSDVDQQDGPASAANPYKWLCETTVENQNQPSDWYYLVCDSVKVQNVVNDTSIWRPNGYPVDYCLSQLVPERCQLSFDLVTIIVVMVANSIKIVVMVLIIRWLNDAPLLNAGDAISSFLTNPDAFTAKNCLCSKQDFDEMFLNMQEWCPRAHRWSKAPRQWYSGAKERHWATLLTLFIITLGACAGLLGYGITQMPGSHSPATLWGYGIGSLHTETLINWHIPANGASGLTGNIIVSNIAQVVLSFMYFSFNNLLTWMLAERELTSFALNRKALRVSAYPRGRQRSSYFLNVPYRFGVPLLALSAVLHWLISQSIFLVAVNRYDPLGGQYDFSSHADADNEDSACNRSVDSCVPTPTHLTCGWSPAAVICVIMVGLLALVYCLALSFRRYPRGMPLMQSCSAVIAAACHPLDVKAQADSGKPLKWGVVLRPTEDAPGHCSFSCGEVEFPEEGCWYS